MDIVDQATGQVTLSFYYDATTSVFIIFNRSVNTAVIFMGNVGVYAIVNLNTSVALLININTQWALVVDVSASLVSAFKTDIGLAITLSAKLINDNKATVTSALLILNANAFQLGLLLTGLGQGSVMWSLAFAFKATLQAKVVASFGALFVAAAARLAAGGIFQASYGTLVILVGVFGTVKGIQQAYLQVIYYIVVKAGGFVAANANLTYNLTYRVSLFFGAFIKGTVTGIAIAAGGAISFVNAAGTVVFQIAAGGAIIVAGAVVAVAGTAAALVGAAGSFLANIAGGFSASISFSAGFGAAGAVSSG